MDTRQTQKCILYCTTILATLWGEVPQDGITLSHTQVQLGNQAARAPQGGAHTGQPRPPPAQS